MNKIISNKAKGIETFGIEDVVYIAIVLAKCIFVRLTNALQAIEFIPLIFNENRSHSIFNFEAVFVDEI